MERHVEVLDERDSLRRPFLGSLILHGSVVALIAVMAWTKVGSKTPWGELTGKGGGGAYSVSPVKSTIQIPPRPGAVQRVANDTESQVPDRVTKNEKRRTVKEDPDAIGLKSRKRPKAEREDRFVSRRNDDRRFESNQVYSQSGAAAVSPLYKMAPGSGGVGVGNGMPFGQRCGGYALLVQDNVASKWKTADVDARVRTLPAAIVNFGVYKDGRIGNIRVTQSSGNRALDFSAQRAVTDASPLPPIPPGCDASNPVTVEFWFELKR